MPHSDITGADVGRAAALAVRALHEVPEPAWDSLADGLEWTCWETVEHLADSLFTYAARFGLAQPPQDALLPFRLRTEREGGPANVFFVDRKDGPEGLFAVVESCAGLAAAVLDGASPETLAHHVFGASDATGFAAMGMTEVLLHTEDVARAAAVDWSPPREWCTGVLDRLFPHVTAQEGDDPWQLLLWSTGRAELPGRARLEEWRWYGAPRFRPSPSG